MARKRRELLPAQRFLAQLARRCECPWCHPAPAPGRAQAAAQRGDTEESPSAEAEPSDISSASSRIVTTGPQPAPLDIVADAMPMPMPLTPSLPVPSWLHDEMPIRDQPHFPTPEEQKVRSHLRLAPAPAQQPQQLAAEPTAHQQRSGFQGSVLERHASTADSIVVADSFCDSARRRSERAVAIGAPNTFDPGSGPASKWSDLPPTPFAQWSDASLVLEVQDYMELHNVPEAGVAQATSLSSAIVSAWLARSYTGPNAAIDIAMRGWLAEQYTQQSTDKPSAAAAQSEGGGSDAVQYQRRRGHCFAFSLTSRIFASLSASCACSAATSSPMVERESGGAAFALPPASSPCTPHTGLAQRSVPPAGFISLGAAISTAFAPDVALSLHHGTYMRRPCARANATFCSPAKSALGKRRRVSRVPRSTIPAGARLSPFKTSVRRTTKARQSKGARPHSHCGDRSRHAVDRDGAEAPRAAAGAAVPCAAGPPVRVPVVPSGAGARPRTSRSTTW